RRSSDLPTLTQLPQSPSLADQVSCAMAAPLPSPLPASPAKPASQSPAPRPAPVPARPASGPAQTTAGQSPLPPSPSDHQAAKNEAREEEDEEAQRPRAVSNTPTPTPSIDPALRHDLLRHIDHSVERAFTMQSYKLPHLLEPMLRQTLRRTLAEQNQGPFQTLSARDDFAWRMKALVSSRSYDELVFERTGRHQVIEAYLVSRADDHLLSHVSHDPARHAEPRLIRSDLARLLRDVHDPEGALLASVPLPRKHLAIVLEKQHSYLIAVFRGQPDEQAHADLDYLHQKLERHYLHQLSFLGSPEDSHRRLQPILESALLIQSPAPPR
ncbi:MAG: hypothetical protein ACQKBY_06175, partial [Verrucomicrobiales bacterium]